MQRDGMRVKETQEVGELDSTRHQALSNCGRCTSERWLTEVCVLAQAASTLHLDMARRYSVIQHRSCPLKSIHLRAFASCT